MESLSVNCDWEHPAPQTDLMRTVDCPICNAPAGQSCWSGWEEIPNGSRQWRVFVPHRERVALELKTAAA